MEEGFCYTLTPSARGQTNEPAAQHCTLRAEGERKTGRALKTTKTPVYSSVVALYKGDA